MLKLKIGCVAALLVVLSGCSYKGKDPASPFYNPALGARLTLNQALTIPDQRASVFIQNGRVSGGGFNRFEPHCRLELGEMSDGSLRLPPATFTVTKVRYETPILVASRGVQLASTVLTPELVMNDSDAPHDVIRLVILTLQGGPGALVRRLSCGGAQNYPALAQPPSINEIRQALGDVATFRQPGE